MRIIVIAFLFLFLPKSDAQIRAVTENGDEVILNNNGTWEYTSVNNQNTEEQEIIPLNSNKFEKDKDASFLLKSTIVNCGFWLDPKKWIVTKAKTNEDAEFSVKHNKKGIYSMIITEEIEVPLTSLKEIALTNARNVASDMKVLNEEYRLINDIKVLHLKLSGKIRGIDFIYFGYYYSNASGTVQFITYSSAKIIEENVKECEDLLNGLVLLEDKK
ncbi:MAG: hypothetical protein KBA06_02250 [Saprospiraceae bacterium]|nr:hypothetical protein [Saprospiraceae bacterium]